MKAAAAKCRFCGEFLAGKPERTPHVGSKPDNSLGLAIGATVASLFCGMCWPLGLAAIVCAAQVDSRWNAGDRSGAERMALWARRLAWWTIGLTLAFWLLIGIAAVLDSL
ncbi:MAG: CD225/dispanin family protein [Planctomycetota bacterium]|nr:MAG: CD225/dispanin family protein [Planctomycetota bacterium]